MIKGVAAPTTPLGGAEIIPPDMETLIWSYSLSLKKGLNLIPSPLRPEKPYTAKSLAALLGATLIIRYDTDQNRFEAYVPAIAEKAQTSTEGFAIKGGEGYIVNVIENKEVKFSGYGWGRPNLQAPPYVADGGETWAFVVSGELDANQPVNVLVKNLRSGTTVNSRADITTRGDFQAIFVDMNRAPVVKAGDILEITVLDNNGQSVFGSYGSYRWQVELEHIQQAYIYVPTPLRLKKSIPEKTRLLANYPNPFNPETWIAYELAEPAEVALSIYDVSGRLIRSLNLGYRLPGAYIDKTNAIYWDGKNDKGERVSSGIYFYSLQAGAFADMGKMVVVK